MIKTCMAVLVLSLLGNAYLLYSLLDAAITLDHGKSQIQSLRERTAISLTVLNAAWVGKSEKDVHVLGNGLASTGAIYKQKNGEIMIDDLVFAVSSGYVRKVSYLD